jgi:YesN/AraC family two-component response regulator
LPARILIADDNSIARTTIRALLDWHSFQVVGEAKNGKEAIERVMELKPDVILLDINMPELNGVKAAYEIRRVSPTTKIVFLTIHNTPATKQVTRLWSHGFVAKSAAGTELIPMLTRLMEKPKTNSPGKPAKSKSRRAIAGE